MPTQPTIHAIVESIKQAIEFAGPVGAKIFPKPVRYRELSNVMPLPGTRPDDLCLVIQAEFWHTFLKLSLWIEALCVHEWCLFTERVAGVDRGAIYVLLTARPDNRRPLTWERHQVDLLLLEGQTSTCPWTAKHIHHPEDYDLDHLIPLVIYPINELWNLVPADPTFNTTVKRDRLPTVERLVKAEPSLVATYQHYLTLPTLAQALADDVSLRFAVSSSGHSPQAVATTVVRFIAVVAEARNVARF
jgi:HNH endonuclease